VLVELVPPCGSHNFVEYMAKGVKGSKYTVSEVGFPRCIGTSRMREV